MISNEYASSGSPRMKSPGLRLNKRLMNCMSIKGADLSVLDSERRCPSTVNVAGQHAGIDQIHFSSKSLSDLTGLRRVTHDEPGHAETVSKSLDLCRSFRIRPLRIAAKPQRTVGMNTEPAAQSEKIF